MSGLPPISLSPASSSSSAARSDAFQGGVSSPFGDLIVNQVVGETPSGDVIIKSQTPESRVKTREDSFTENLIFASIGALAVWLILKNKNT